MGHHGTPLRYPGGKQRLTPFLTELLIANNLIGCHYSEPYAGGAGAAINLLLTNKVGNIHLNDSSIGIYSFWRSILSHPETFCQLISSASLTIDEWKRHREIIRNPQNYNELEVGFSTFYLNRCNRSGVISGGVIGGLEQKGKWKIDARFSRNELIRRIEAIAIKGDLIAVTNMDGEDYIKNYIPALPENTLVYCDPPYYEKSSKLYLNSYKKDDHSRLAQVIQNELPRKWLLSYDGAPEIISLYKERRLFLYDLQYNASKVYKGKEVYVFCEELELPDSSSLSYIDKGLQSIKGTNKVGI